MLFKVIYNKSLQIFGFVGGFTPHREQHPQAPGCFWLKPPRPLVIGYHWITFLNQVPKNLPFSKNFEYNIDHSSKYINQKIVFSYFSEYCASFRTNIFFRQFWWDFGQFSKNFVYKIYHFSKNKKSQKLENCFFIGFRTLRIFYPNLASFEGGFACC